MSDTHIHSERRVVKWTAPPLVETREENCPECWQQCGWCSANRLMCRSVGCATIYPKKGKCEKGEQEKGKKCSTCDGSGRVKVRREILKLPKEEMPERLTFVLGSGDSATIDKAGAVRWLKHLFEFYNDQEKDWHDKTYNGERTLGGFNQGYENEWQRYRQEAASLAFAIHVISGEAP